MREYALLLVVVLLFSGNILVGKAAVDALPSFTLALSRCLIALAAALLCFGRPAWRARHQFAARSGRLFVIGAAGVGLFNAFLYAALHTADPNSVAVLEATIPLFTALVMWLVVGERLSVIAWGGVLLSTVGASIVVSRGMPFALWQNATVGDFIMLGAIAAWIVYALIGQRGLAGLPGLATMVPLAASACIVLLPLALIENLWLAPDLSISPTAIWAALYLGLGPSFVGFIIYNRALVRLGPTIAAVSLNGLPLVVMTGSWAWLDIPINGAQVAGTMAVVVGMTLLVLYRTPARS